VIRDKNIFECIIINDHIWFPNYVYYGPPSHGMQRRSAIFKKAFPSLGSSICTKHSWEKLRKNNWNERKVFKYDEDTRKLKETKVYTNAWGDPIYAGEKFELNENVHVIQSLSIVKYAGLICTYKDNKKTNLSQFTKDLNDNIWRIKNGHR
jgi:hypothetical protein